MSNQSGAPTAEPMHLRELTIRGILLGVFITIIFTASNVYLRLKVGMTFASSIPAAVISMAVLRFCKGSNILENNMVQTQVSSAGCLPAVIFVMPALLLIGYWQNFDFWQTFLICAAGGTLGVIFTVPLRHVMIVERPLPFPEGIAAAEILKTGEQDGKASKDGADPHEGIKLLVAGSFISGIFALIVNGLRAAGSSIALTFKSGSAVFHFPFGFSFAMLGAGYIMGIAGGMAILIGIVFTWAGAVPLLTSMIPAPDGTDPLDWAMTLWAKKVRFIGAGTIAIAAVWTLISLSKPMLDGIRMSFNAFSGKNGQSRERIFQDLSPRSMVVITVLMVVIIAGAFWDFVQDAPVSAGLAWLLVFIGVIAAVLIGFMVASACGYMAGLIGSSSSPISGIGIISIIAMSLIFLAVGSGEGIMGTEGGARFLTALAVFTTSVVVAVACISNDNLQDLKTGHLVGATPWRQQVALIIGCFVGAIVIAPVMGLLYQAYGLPGAMPREGMDETLALAAPQATMMTQIVQGIFTQELEWTYIVIGLIFGAAVIICDLLLKKMSGGRITIPALAVGLGIYLPAEINTPLIAGALISWFSSYLIAKKHHDEGKTAEAANHRGTLLAAGFIVGESILGVILALIIVLSVTSGGSDSPLSLGLEHWESAGAILGLVLFVAGMCYFWHRIQGKKA